MGLQDQLILSIPVIDEKQEDDWICQEIFEKVKLHIEENKDDVFTTTRPPVLFKLDVKHSDNKTSKTKPTSPTSPGSASPKRSPRKLCRKCVYADCCQTNVRRKRFHGNRKSETRKQQVPVTTKPETHEQMERFADILLAEMDVSDLEIENTLTECYQRVESHTEQSEKTGKMEQHRKLTRSISYDETRRPRLENAIFKRRWSESRSESPILKQNVVSWAYEGHSAF